MRNKEQYAHTLSCSLRLGLGCSRLSTTLSKSILLESCKQTGFPVSRQRGGGRCPGWRGTGPCSIRARQTMAPQYTDFLSIAHWAQLHILMDQIGPLTSDFSSVGHSYNLLKNLWQGVSEVVLKHLRNSSECWQLLQITNVAQRVVNTLWLCTRGYCIPCCLLQGSPPPSLSYWITSRNSFNTVFHKRTKKQHFWNTSEELNI